MPDFNLRLSSPEALVAFDAALPHGRKLLRFVWVRRALSARRRDLRGPAPVPAVTGQKRWAAMKDVALVTVPKGRRILDDSDPENAVIDDAVWLNVRMSRKKAAKDRIGGDPNWREDVKVRVKGSQLRLWAEQNELETTRQSRRTRKDIRVYRWERGEHWAEIIIDPPA